MGIPWDVPLIMVEKPKTIKNTMTCAIFCFGAVWFHQSDIKCIFWYTHFQDYYLYYTTVFIHPQAFQEGLYFHLPKFSAGGENASEYIPQPVCQKNGAYLQRGSVPSHDRSR